jgi:hypothetical protein
MSWTQPKTWTSEPLTSTDLNTHLRDNLEILKDPPSDDYTLNQGADYGTTGTSFANVDGTNLSLTITTGGGDVIVHFDGYLLNATGYVALDISIDGVRHFGDDGICRIIANSQGPISFTRLITGLAAGSHTFNLMWKVNAGTAVMYAGAGTANFDIHPQFWGREVS